MNEIFSFGCDGTTFEDKLSGTPFSIIVMTYFVGKGVFRLQNIGHSGSLLKIEGISSRGGMGKFRSVDDADSFSIQITLSLQSKHQSSGEENSLMLSDELKILYLVNLP